MILLEAKNLFQMKWTQVWILSGGKDAHIFLLQIK